MNFAAEYEARCLENSDIRDHLPYLYEQSAGKMVIELGVRSGNSTAAFLAAGARVWSVDLIPPQVPVSWLDYDGWTFIPGDDLAHEVRDQLPRFEVDIVFIDTSHHYRQTLDELDMYAVKLRPGGRFMMHDTELERPDGAPDVDVPFPVRRAIEDWVAETGWTVEWRPGCYGLGVITKPAVMS